MMDALGTAGVFYAGVIVGLGCGCVLFAILTAGKVADMERLIGDLRTERDTWERIAHRKATDRILTRFQGRYRGWLN